MLCSICLAQIDKYKFIPCGHHVCYNCNLQRQNENQNYLCDICLQTYHAEDINSENANANNKSINGQSDLLFCYKCSCTFEMIDFKNSWHRFHNFALLEKAVPQLKKKALNQIQRGLIIEQFLAVQKQLIQSRNFQLQFKTLQQQIQTYFNEQAALLQEKKASIILKASNMFNSMFEQIINYRDRIQQLHQQISAITQNLGEFVQGKISYAELQTTQNILFPFEQYSEMLKELKNKTFALPKFVVCNSIKNSLQNICTLHNAFNIKTKPDNSMKKVSSVRLLARFNKHFQLR